MDHAVSDFATSSSASSLSAIEAELNSISPEFFESDPRRFKTLHHVISVLAASGAADGSQDLQSNEAYKHLQRQRRIVEDGISTVTRLRYRELNAGVAGLGRVSRDFEKALKEVKRLRRQVNSAKSSLEADLQRSLAPAPSGLEPSSLKALYAKKRECASVLGILSKLSSLRAAPSRFDSLVAARRLHAAVEHLSESLETLFSPDVANVKALAKVSEELMMRKGATEEVREGGGGGSTLLSSCRLTSAG